MKEDALSLSLNIYIVSETEGSLTLTMHRRFFIKMRVPFAFGVSFHQKINAISYLHEMGKINFLVDLEGGVVWSFYEVIVASWEGG